MKSKHLQKYSQNLRGIVKELAKDSFLHFILYTKRNYQAKWFHKLLADKLDLFAKGEIKRLMVYLPPQHGKSELVSRRLPAYLLGRNPKLNIAVASYAQALASSFNRETQRIIDNEYYAELFPDVRLATSGDMYNRGEIKRTHVEFEIAKHYGRLLSVGVKGALTGKPVDIGIIDDPIKDAEQASSLLYRDTLWEWYLYVFLSRMNNDSQILITLTRWHEDDLAGRIMAQAKESGEEWEIVILPAIKEHDNSDYDIRVVGEALWPEKHSYEKIMSIKAKSPRVFYSLYQQQPSPDSGNKFKLTWIKPFSMYELRNRAHDEEVELVWDFAIDSAYTNDIKNDPTALLCFSRAFGNLYVRAAESVMMEFPELIKYVPSFCYANGYSKKSRIWIEPRASGLSLAQMLRSQTGLNVIIDTPPRVSKEARAERCTPFVEAGRMYVLEAAAWQEDYLHQLKIFPNGTHDDFVDCTTIAIDKIEMSSEMKFYGFAAL